MVKMDDKIKMMMNWTMMKDDKLNDELDEFNFRT